MLPFISTGITTELHFSFITKEEFNKQKQNNPDMVVGNLFNKVA